MSDYLMLTTQISSRGELVPLNYVVAPIHRIGNPNPVEGVYLSALLFTLVEVGP